MSSAVKLAASSPRVSLFGEGELKVSTVLAAKKLGSRFSSPLEVRPSQPDPAHPKHPPRPANPSHRPTHELASREEERLLLEKKLHSLSQARDAVDWVEQALAEASRLDGAKLRSGVATKKRRELEAAVEGLDKEVASLKSRLRMLLNNKY